MVTQGSRSVEVCPNCGNLVELLLDDTGWCPTCTLLPLHAGGASLCAHCGAVHKETGRLCGRCKRENWNKKHSSVIKVYMDKGYTYREARALASEVSRPLCVICGQRIKGGNERSMFCSATTECRRARRRYLYLYQSKGIPKATALNQVIQERAA